MPNEAQQTVLDRLNHFQAVFQTLKVGDEAYFTVNRVIDTLVSRLATVYEQDVVLNPRTNTWE